MGLIRWRMAVLVEMEAERGKEEWNLVVIEEPDSVWVWKTSGLTARNGIDIQFFRVEQR